MLIRFEIAQRLCFTLCCAALACGCGARTPLGIDNGQGPLGGDGGSDSPGVSCGNGAKAKVVTSLTLESPTNTSSPVSTPHLAWTGSELLVAWTGAANGGYAHKLAAVHVKQGSMVVSSSSSVDPGKTTNPFHSSVAWDGAQLARFWPQDDGSIVMRRFGADAAPVDEAHTVVPPSGGQMAPSSKYFSVHNALQSSGLTRGADIHVPRFRLRLRRTAGVHGNPGLGRMVHTHGDRFLVADHDDAGRD